MFAARSGGLHCASIVLTLNDGRTSSFLLDSPIPDKTSMSEALLRLGRHRVPGRRRHGPTGRLGPL